MMKGIDAKHSVKRCTGPWQTLSRPLRESGSRRLGLRMSQHLTRGIQTRHANPTVLERPKPMAGTAANLEYTLVGMLADEGNQRCLDTRIVVFLVASVIRSGDVVVVY